MSGDAVQAADVWNKLYDDQEATVPPERFTKALKSKAKNKVNKTVLAEFKQLAPRFETSLKRTARIVGPGRGMGGFMDPPEYPTHKFHIAEGRRSGGMSLTSESVSRIDPLTRKEVRELITNWKQNRPSLDSPEVKKWISEVLGYMGNGYRNPNAASDKQWHASNLIFDRMRDPVRNAKDHAGVHLIRRFYPEFTPTENDFAGARWGNG